MQGDAMLGEDMEDEQLGQHGGCDGIDGCDKDQLLGEAVNDDQYHVRAIGHWQLVSSVEYLHMALKAM